MDAQQFLQDRLGTLMTAGSYSTSSKDGSAFARKHS